MNTPLATWAKAVGVQARLLERLPGDVLGEQALAEVVSVPSTGTRAVMAAIEGASIYPAALLANPSSANTGCSTNTRTLFTDL